MTEQMHLFPTIIKSIYLEADSAKNAYYYIRIEEYMGVYCVIKESGANGKMLDRRKWPMDNYAKAMEFYKKKLKQKFDPRRKTRIYRKAA